MPPVQTVTPDQVVVGEIPSVPPAFVQRSTLQRLSDTLDRTHVAVVCALTGMRGVGKTQLAAAYARTRIDEGCGVVGWVNAESGDELLAGLTRVAGKLGIADPYGDPVETARRLTENLATRRGDALLVFDNAGDPASVLRFVPATGARVIVTSTNRSFAQLGEPVEVDTFSRPESTTYLHERTELDDTVGATEVARELGDLPLALSSAAATINARKLGYRSYLKLLEDRTVADAMPNSGNHHYPGSTAAALALNVRTVAGADPSRLGARLIGVIALLSADGVSRDFLNGLSTSPSDDVAGDDVEKALEQCVAGSVLSWSINGDAVIMHRLLARVIWEQARIDNYFKSLAIATLDLIQAQQIDPSDGWSRRREGLWLVSHVEALWEAISQVGPIELT